MYKILKLTAAGLMLGTPVFSGGWEANRLDTSMMYNDNGYAEVSTSSISYDLYATNQSSVKHKMAKDQTRTTLSFKNQYGNFDVGLTRYMSGAIQLDGQAGALMGTNLVPSADVTATSLALLGRYRINDNISAFAGLNRYEVETSTVQTVYGLYQVSGDEIVPVMGAAYENKEIALRVEAVLQVETDMALTARSGVRNAGVAATTPVPAGSKLVVPQTMTLNFQSGIAEDTLLFGSIHKADWKTAQISVLANGPIVAVNSNFSNKTAYSLGIGRKINDQLSLIGSYSTEDGGGSTSADPFTLTDGYQTIGLAARYTKDNMTFTAGYSYSKVGDVTVTVAPLSAAYKDNEVTGIGAKLGFSF